MSGRSLWTYENGILWGLDAGAEPVQLAARVTTTFAEVTQARAEELAQAIGLASPAPIQERWRAGRRCFAGWVDDTLATYGWVSQGVQAIGELERELRLPPGEAYIWDCATLPAYRGQRLYSALLLSIVRTLRAEGLGRVWIGSARANKPSWHGFANVGFRPVLAMAYARVVNISLALLSAERGAAQPMVSAARQALLRPNERTLGPLAVSWI